MNKYTALNNFKIILLACLLVLLSCRQERALDVKPEGLIAEDKMVNILIDIHLTESAVSLKNFNRDSSLVLFAFYKEAIYKKHKIAEKQFKESFDYYAKHSAVFDHMYEAVIDSLDVKEAKGKLK